MAPVTREQLQIAQRAQAILPKPGVRLATPLDVRAFADVVRRDPGVALAAKELYIRLRASLPIAIIYTPLKVAIRITELTLFLPPSTPSTLLDEVSLERLVAFKTNLPHRHLAKFLSSQHSVRHLYLGACGRKSSGLCPLSSLDLGRIHDVGCPANCLAAVLHPGVEKLVSEILAPGPSPTTVFLGLPYKLLKLSVLTLDFFAGDSRLLRAIAAVAPHLTHLKLLEKLSPCRPAKDMWTARRSLPACLRRLRDLEELALKTSSRFVQNRGSLEDEFDMITCLTTYRPGGDIVREHPALTYISVWYRTQESTHGVVSRWSRSPGHWTRYGSVVHPEKGSDF